jgi:transporter family protein
MGLAAKFASSNLSPITVQVISTLGMIPTVVVLLLSPNLKKVHGKFRVGVGYSILVGMVTAIAAIAMFSAFNAGGPASIVVPINSLASLVTVLLAWYFFREKLNPYQITGVVLSIIALILFNVESDGAQTDTMSWYQAIMSKWMLLALLSLLAAGTAQFFIKAATNHVSADLVTFIVVIVFLFLAGMLIFTDSFSWNMSLKDLIACLLVGVLGSVAFLTNTVAYSSGMASLVAPLCSLFPVVTVILAVPILGEKLTWLIIIAVVISSVAGFALSIEKPPLGEINANTVS